MPAMRFEDFITDL